MGTVGSGPAGTPSTLKAAAALLAFYGLGVLANAIVGQVSTGWVDAANFPRGVVRTAGCLVLAWGLLKTKRWAWWISVLLIGLWTILGVGGAALLIFLFATSDEIAVELPRFLGFAILLLALVEILLLLPSTRRAFREVAAQAPPD